MPNGIYLTLEQYKDKDLPITITINGHTYHSQFALATTQTTWFEMGKQHGMELGADNTYSDKEMSRMHDAWYDEGYEAGKAEATSDIEMQWMHDQWYNEGYADGYKQGKQAGISKINLNTEPVEQSELSKEYDKGFTKGYEEGKEEEFDRGWAYGYDAGKSEGYEIGKKANGISNKEIPGEYLSHIEEARLEGYKEGYSDAKEGGQAEGYIDGPEQTEYAKGYEDGKMDLMQFIGNNRG
jgi:flagellar biosynthesis/type III secretory pathway protein FliH